MTTMDDSAPRGTWSRVASVVSVVLLAISLAMTLARFTGFEVRPLAALIAFVPWMVWVAAGALALAAVARAWIPAVAAALVLAVNVWWLSPLFTSEGSGEVEFTVVTLNAEYGEADAAQIVRLVEDSDASLLTIQELTPDLVERLDQAGLGEILPHSVTKPQTNHAGIGLWSRTQIKQPRALDDLSSWAVRGEIASTQGDLTVFAVHPLPPLPRGHVRWAEDMEALIDVVDAVQGPVLVAGDFNTTRDHASFRRLQRLGFVDESDEAGAGLLFTFPEGGAVPPAIAIDHVLTRDAQWAAVAVRTVTITGTDHRALVVDYAAR